MSCLDPDLPDTGVVCCMGSAVYGPAGCTCWDAEYDAEQQTPVPAATPTRPLMCDGCAYRPNSPERTGVSRAGADEDALRDLAMSGRPFYCHDGMRRAVRLRHPTGAVVELDVDALAPASFDPAYVDGKPYCADGTPAALCAGWDAWRRRAARDAAAVRQ